MTEKEKIENNQIPITSRLKLALRFAGHHLFSLVGAVASAVSTASYSASEFCDDSNDTKKPTR